tara:strand:+ start:37 stop:276 length:240 start_codon:yes stop_codon:yes gene_type:complete
MSSKIFPQCSINNINLNDPISARIYENYLTSVKAKSISPKNIVIETQEEISQIKNETATPMIKRDSPPPKKIKIYKFID